MPESHTLVVALGDVSGKGCRPRLYSVFAGELVRGRTFRREFQPERSSPAQVLTSINTILHERQLEDVLLHALLCRLRHQAQNAHDVQLGLPYPVRSTTEDTGLIELPGVPLGAFVGVNYDDVSFPLHAGDVFVFCSDGVCRKP
jgi:serine phosphatase RsbU (regulator of sigma subunit)